MPDREQRSTSAAPSAPDWTTRPALPGEGWCAANVASSPIPGTAMPKQFGPIRPCPPAGWPRAGWILALA